MMGQFIERAKARRWSALRTARVVLASAALAVALPIACGSEEDSGGATGLDDPEPRGPTGMVQVTVEFPSEEARTGTNSLHMWVLVPEGDGGATCAALIGGTSDPYDLVNDRRADAVSTDPAAGVSAEAETGRALVYVEAVDHAGRVKYAGCAELSVSRGDNAVTIDLTTARVFDCAHPDTQDGDPCDDGQKCTVDEKCDAGECGSGKSRDCSYLSDGCNGADCAEDVEGNGCYSFTLADGTPCDDERNCTEGDVCTAGECEGAALDCSAQAGECEVAQGCDEVSGCMVIQAPNNTACDDGYVCTVNEYCYYGTCQGGTSLDCTEGGCVVGTCVEPTGCTGTPVVAGSYCTDNDYCTITDQCDGAGNCVGSSPRDCSSYTYGCYEGQCNPSTGSCQQVPLAAGSVCNDNNACTTGETCNATGTCTGGTPVSCSHLDSGCTVGQCSTSTGCYTQNRPSGTACNDNNACTEGEYCSIGTCSFGTTTDGDNDGYYLQGCGTPQTEDCNDMDPLIGGSPCP